VHVCAFVGQRRRQHGRHEEGDEGHFRRAQAWRALIQRKQSRRGRVLPRASPGHALPVGPGLRAGGLMVPPSHLPGRLQRPVLSPQPAPHRARRRQLPQHATGAQSTIQWKRSLASALRDVMFAAATWCLMRSQVVLSLAGGVQAAVGGGRCRPVRRPAAVAALADVAERWTCRSSTASWAACGLRSLRGRGGCWGMGTPVFVPSWAGALRARDSNSTVVALPAAAGGVGWPSALAGNRAPLRGRVHVRLQTIA